MFLQIEVIGLKTQVTGLNSMAYVTKEVRLSEWTSALLVYKKYATEYVIYAIGSHMWLLLTEWVPQ